VRKKAPGKGLKSWKKQQQKENYRTENKRHRKL